MGLCESGIILKDETSLQRQGRIKNGNQMLVPLRRYSTIFQDGYFGFLMDSPALVFSYQLVRVSQRGKFLHLIPFERCG